MTGTGFGVGCGAGVDSDVTVRVTNTTRSSSSSYNGASFSSFSSTPRPSSTSSSSIPSHAPSSAHIFEIELNEAVAPSNITKEEVQQVVQQILGNSAVVVDVELIGDEHGNVASVVVSFECDDCADVVVEIIKEHLDSIDCTAGVLCHATDVFLVDPSSSHSISVGHCTTVLTALHFVTLFGVLVVKA